MAEHSAEKNVTGWCARANHEGCDGTLHTGAGLHWFCACTCHPEPPANAPGGADRAKAIEAWLAARATSPGSGDAS